MQFPNTSGPRDKQTYSVNEEASARVRTGFSISDDR
jgi:hypothetical protein